MARLPCLLLFRFQSGSGEVVARADGATVDEARDLVRAHATRMAFSLDEDV